MDIKIKKILATEKLQRADYPLQLDKIRYDGTEVILKNVLNAEVSYDENEKLYYISFPDLNLFVLGRRSKRS